MRHFCQPEDVTLIDIFCSLSLLYLSYLVFDLIPPHDFCEDGETAVDDDVGGGGVGFGHVAEDLDRRVHQPTLHESYDCRVILSVQDLFSKSNFYITTMQIRYMTYQSPNLSVLIISMYLLRRSKHLGVKSTTSPFGNGVSPKNCRETKQQLI